MTKSLTALAAAIIAVAAAAQPAQFTKPVIPADPALEAKVEKTLARMTLEEKIGQMTEIQLDVIGRMTPEGNFELVESKMDTVFGIYKVGSILNAPYSVCLDARTWNTVIGGIQKYSMKHLGIPCIYGLDQNHGTTYTRDGVLFPQPLNMGATFNTDLVRRGAEITAYQTRASDCPWVYNPTLDLARDPRWPRFWENYGEDVLVNAVMGATAVRGYQGDDPNHLGPLNVATSVKHYLGYGSPFSGKDRTPAYLSESDLREKYFAPFLAALKAGALTIMVNSSSINGEPVHASSRLLTKWLKDELGWDGMIVTDWADINNLYTREKVAADKKEAIALAINAGIDMAMEPYNVDYCTILRELVEEGTVPMSRIDDAARRVIRLKYRLGLFDRPDTWLKNYPEFNSPEFAAEATEAAVESMVLLKNDHGLLPLAEGTKILVTGPNANSMRSLNGGWSYTWQGHLADSYTEDKNTIQEALTARFGAGNVTFISGLSYDPTGFYDKVEPDRESEALFAAESADVIIVCIGENSYCETPGNLTDLNINPLQSEYVKKLAATGKPIVLVLNEGRPRIISGIEPLAQAVIDIMLPSNYGGDALAMLIAGDRNFSGKLPFTYPREINSLVTYDYKVSEEVGKMEGVYDYDARVNVQWPFGYGKSYTTFSYSNLRADKAEFTAADMLTFTVDVANTGNVTGKEAVLLYSSDLVASLVPDNKRLRAFTKIELKPGETKTVSLTIPASDLAFVGSDGKWRLEKGDFRITVAGESIPLRCTATHLYPDPNI